MKLLYRRAQTEIKLQALESEISEYTEKTSRRFAQLEAEHVRVLPFFTY